jgi:hypothetical protein
MPPFHQHHPVLRQWNLSKNVGQALSWCKRRGGKKIVMATVLMIHPRMVLHVDPLASPWSIFLTEEGSLRKILSPGSTEQKT